ncbi:MAG TPA: LamG domain-containing protein [Planctomycetota bacterium]|nr:LamG domain-containing protein [Planctomycetota bacterium]
MLRISAFPLFPRIGCLLVVALAVGGGRLDAAVVTWDGGGADTNWSTVLNWSTDAVPTTADNVVFDATSTKNCTINVAAGIDVVGISIGAGYTGGLGATITQAPGVRIRIGTGGWTQAKGIFAGGNSAIVCEGAFTVSDGTFTSTSATLNVIGAFTTAAGTFADNSGTVALKNSAAQTLACADGFNNLAIDSGLVAYWPLDGNALDASGSGHHGTPTSAAYAGSAASTSFANTDSLDFDGATSRFDATSPIRRRINSWTISAWIHPQALPQAEGVILNIGDENTGVALVVGGPGGGSNLHCLKNMVAWEDSTYVFPATNAWYHVVLVSEPDSDSLIYVDGVLIRAVNFGNPILPLDRVQIGYQDRGGGVGWRWFDGRVDDARIYDRAITADEVATLAAGGRPVGGPARTLAAPLDVDGDLTLLGDLTTTTHAIALAGAWNNLAGVFTPGSATVTLDGATATTKDLRTRSQAFNDLVVASADGLRTWSVQDSLSVGDDLTVSNGLLACGSGEVAVGGDFLLSGGTCTATSGIMSFSGSFTRSGGTWSHNSGTVAFRPTANQVVTNAQAFNHVVLNSGMVGYWPCDEGVGGTTADLSGSGRPAALNTAGWSAAVATSPGPGGVNPACLDLDGTDSVETAELDASRLAGNAVTISAWVRHRAVPVAGIQRYVTIGNEVAVLRSQGGDYHFYSILSGTVRSITHPVTDTGWHLITGTWNGTTQCLFIDGALVGAETPPGSLPTAGIMQFGSAGEPFDGFIDDVRVYDRALSPAEISALAIGGMPGVATVALSQGGALTISGDLRLVSGTLAANGFDLALAGSWFNHGGIYAPGTRKVSLTGTTAQVILSGCQRFHDLDVTGSGTWTLQDRLNVAGTLTVSGAGAIDVSTTNHVIHAANIAQGAGDIVERAGTIVIDPVAAGAVTATSALHDLRIESPIGTGLVGYWKFDEGFGNVARDSSAQANPGALSGVASWSTEAAATDHDNPRSMRFDGGSGSVIAQDIPAYGITGDITIAAWVKRDGTARNDYILTRNTGPVWDYLFYIDNTDHLQFWADSIGGHGSAGTIADTAWHHVAVTRIGALGTFYIDGVADAQTFSNANAFADSAGMLMHIGSEDGNQYYKGLMDEVRLYARGLSAAEIANLAAGRYPDGGSAATVTVGGALSVAGALAIDSGVFDAGGNTVQVTDDFALASGDGVYQASTATQAFLGSFAIAGSSFAGSSGMVDIAGDLAITGGTFTAPSGTLAIAGDFSHSGGTFTHNAGTVVLDGGDQAIGAGARTFNNLTKTVTSAAALTFPAGSANTQTVLGTLTLQGSAVGPTYLSLRGAGGGGRWRIAPQGGRAISWVDVADSHNTTSTMIGPGNAIDSGNTLNWFTSALDKYWIGAAAGLFSVDGNWSTSSNGPPDTTAPTASDVAIFDAGKDTSCSIDVAASVRGLTIAAGHTQAIVPVPGAAVNVGADGWVQSAGVFTGGTGTVSVSDFTLAAGTFTAPSTTMTVSGDWTNTAGTFTAGTGTVRFTTPGATTSTVASGGDAFHHLTFSGAGTLQPTSALTLTGDLTCQAGAGTFDAATSDPAVTVADDVIQDNTAVSLGDGTWTIAGDFDCGDVTTFNANASSVVMTGASTTLTSPWWQSFHHLTFSGETVIARFITGSRLTATGTCDLAFGAHIGDVRVGPGADITGTGELGLFWNATISQMDGVIDCATLRIVNDHDQNIAPGRYDSALVRIANESTSSLVFRPKAGTYTFAGHVHFANTGTADWRIDNSTNNADYVFEGSVTVSNTGGGTLTWTKGTGTLTFSGAGAGTQTLDFLGKNVEALVIDDAGAVKQLTGSAVTCAGLTVADGTFSLNGQNVTLSAGAVANDGEIRLRGDETLTGISDLDTDSGTVTYVGRNLTETLAVKDFGASDYHHLTIADTGGDTTFALGAALGLSGDCAITGGALSAGTHAIALSGDWHNQVGAAGFVCGTGTVTLGGADQAISGSTTFRNLTKSVATARTLTFAAGSRQTVLDTLILQGASGNLLSLRSSTPGTPWRIDPQQTRTCSFLDVRDGTNLRQPSINPSGSLNSGNNSGWFGRTSGRAQGGSGAGYPPMY